MVGEAKERLSQILEDHLDVEGVMGTSLVSRDGIPVLSRLTERMEEMPFSLLVEGAMTATLMGAAEVAVQEVGGGPPRRVVVETEKVNMVLVGVSDDLILVTVAESSAVLADLLEAVDAAAGNVSEAVAAA